MSGPAPKKAGEDDVYLAAVEGGGTTFVVSVARLVRGTASQPMPAVSQDAEEAIEFGPDVRFEILKKLVVPSTGNPQDTLDKCCEFFRTNRPEGVEQYDGVGIATFGPVGVNPDALDTYGLILPSSPKADWRNVDVLAPILGSCSSNEDGDLHMPPPHMIDTDVNAPAVAEFNYHNTSVASAVTTRPPAKPLSSLAYITVGTGVGVGLIINNLPVHGMMHPEGGHTAVVPLENDTFPGYSWGKDNCPYKGVNTVEGIASSVALTERITHEEKKKSGIFGIAQVDPSKREGLKDLPDDHYVWSHTANALANLCVNLVLTTSVQRIVLGGGIMKRTILFDQIRSKTREILNGYIDLPQVTTDEGLQSYIAPETWKDKSGLVGALVLAMTAYDKHCKKHEEDHMRHLASIAQANSRAKEEEQAPAEPQRTMEFAPAAAIAASAIVGATVLVKGLSRRQVG